MTAVDGLKTFDAAAGASARGAARHDRQVPAGAVAAPARRVLRSRAVSFASSAASRLSYCAFIASRLLPELIDLLTQRGGVGRRRLRRGRLNRGKRPRRRREEHERMNCA